MVELAKHCEFTRRALYFYFSSKEEALRAVVAYFNDIAIEQGLQAGEVVRQAGGSAIDILAETLDIRYGDTRRRVSRSPYLVELNGEIFRRCHDLMVESALVFHRELETYIRRLEADGILRLKLGVLPTELARLLADGARGVNQTLPPLAAEEFAPRYRAMTSAILFGSAVAVDSDAVNLAVSDRSASEPREERSKRRQHSR